MLLLPAVLSYFGHDRIFDRAMFTNTCAGHGLPELSHHCLQTHVLAVDYQNYHIIDYKHMCWPWTTRNCHIEIPYVEKVFTDQNRRIIFEV